MKTNELEKECYENEEEFGMGSIKKVKYTPNKVKEVEYSNNGVEIE